MLIIYKFYKLYIKYNHNTHKILLQTFYLASIPSKKLLTSGYLKYPLLTGKIWNVIDLVYLGPRFT